MDCLRMKVLIADDDPTIQLILKAQVSSWGYEVVIAKTGQQALAAFETIDPPKLAVLDWMMPELDGVQVCQKIKENEKQFCYVILLTSKDKDTDVAYALDSGADDYIRKPVNSRELKSRLSVGERTVTYELKLKDFGNRMESLAMARAQQLVHADRLSTVGRLAAGVVHEINNPIGYISGNAQILDMYWKILEPIVRREAENGGGPKLAAILKDVPEIVESITSGVERVSKIVKRMKQFARKEHDREPTDVNDCVRHALELCNNQLKYHVFVIKELAEGLSRAELDSQQIEQVLVNLFVNAADAMDGRKDGELTVRTFEKDGSVVITVQDNGGGISDEHMAHIWDSFYTTKSTEKGTGLGLSISQDIIEDHGGTIEVKNSVNSKNATGACFTISLPIKAAVPAV